MTAQKKARRATVGAVCAATTSLAIVYNFVGDKTVWGVWLSIAPPIFWAVAFIPTLVRLRSWLAAAFVVAFVATTSEFPRLGASTRASVNTIRLVSWNIGAGNTKWADAVETLQPDIVLVQESSTPTESWDGFSWTGTPDPGTLSRFPVEVLPTAKVGPWTEPQLLLTEIRGKKVILANVRLMLPSPVIQLVAPFEESPISNYRARIAQYEKLAALLKSTFESTGADVIILGGDFNVPVRMPSLTPLREFLRDAWSVAGHGWGATMPEFLPLTRIDHVWMSEGIEIVSVRVRRLPGSDHRAIIVDFEL